MQAVPSVIETSPSARVLLTDIAPGAFQHSLDRQATEQLKKVKGFDLAVSKFIEFGFERIMYVLNIASSVQVGPRQYPRIYAMAREAAAVLDVPEPEVYVSEGPANAFTAGHARPYIMLYSTLIDLMDDDELLAVIGHETGHIKCGHVLYKAMARTANSFAQLGGGLITGLPIVGSMVNLLSAGIDMALIAWDRRSEYSADRAALLVTQSVRPCVSMLAKLAGGSFRMAADLDPAAFLEQAKEYGEDMDATLLDRVYRFLAGSYKGTHPFIVERTKELNDWVDSNQYEQILAGDYLRDAPPPPAPGLCPNGHPVAAGSRFCGTCGAKLGL